MRRCFLPQGCGGLPSALFLTLRSDCLGCRILRNKTMPIADVGVAYDKAGGSPWGHRNFKVSGGLGRKASPQSSPSFWGRGWAGLGVGGIGREPPPPPDLWGSVESAAIPLGPLQRQEGDSQRQRKGGAGGGGRGLRRPGLLGGGGGRPPSTPRQVSACAVCCGPAAPLPSPPLPSLPSGPFPSLLVPPLLSPPLASSPSLPSPRPLPRGPERAPRQRHTARPPSATTHTEQVAGGCGAARAQAGEPGARPG